jgi:hypothetical protein
VRARPGCARHAPVEVEVEVEVYVDIDVEVGCHGRGRDRSGDDVGRPRNNQPNEQMFLTQNVCS